MKHPLETMRERDYAIAATEPQRVEAHPDDAAVDRFASAMKAKLAASRDKGRSGWQTCPAWRLQEMLVEHISKGDPVDVANFAMMLGLRGEKTVQQERIQRPNARDVGRYGDMSQEAHIRVGFDSDNDVFVSVWDGAGGATVEFCTPGAGGGHSSETRVALIALMVAMEEDNARTPRLDWWAQRMSAAKG